MSRKKTVLALTLGFTMGFLLKETLEANKRLTPDKALKLAKETFEKNGPISGSWIYMKPEKLEKNSLTYDTYHGGISRNMDGETKQFDFYIDIETGTIIDSKPAVS
jgi:predicted small secreted protein